MRIYHEQANRNCKSNKRNGTECLNPECFAFAGYASIADRVIAETLRPRFSIDSNSTKTLLRELFGDVVYDRNSGRYVYYMPKSVNVVGEIIEDLATKENVDYPYMGIFYGKNSLQVCERVS